MNQSMQVWIYACQFADDPAYQGSALSLPAHQEAVRDAFQRARLKEGEPYLLERGQGLAGIYRIGSGSLQSYAGRIESVSL